MSNEYKDTLLIGQTDFEMRAHLSEKEPKFEEFWRTNKIYNQKLKLNEGKPLFILHDGPPYANGNIHVGHALNKTLKDFIVRWKNSNGFKSPYIMGWDTHGLPIENAVTKSGVNRKEMDPVAFRDLCKEYALKQVAGQSKGFERLGIFTDYDVNYLTLYPWFEKSELRLFEKMFNKGLVYKALKPIYWSPSSESALAESEIEYHDIKAPTIYVEIDLKDSDKLPKGTKTIIWTTTPWTIPTNQLIAVGPALNYSVVEVKNKNGEPRTYVVNTDLVKTLTELLEWTDVKEVKVLKGKDLAGIEYLKPWTKDVSKIVTANYVTNDSGTGLVHTAGGFGEDDYNTVKANGLDVYAPIDNQGKFTSEINDKSLDGVFYDDANKMVTTKLADEGKLLKLKFLTHSYPHDWRTKKPVIYRATLQWFINVNKVKKEILSKVDDVTTYPKWAKQRLYQVLDDRTDWTISRQRLWGVPIVGFYGKDDELVLNSDILNYAITKLEELGLNAWFSEPADTFLPDEFKGKGLRKEKDILDVWFDSGSSSIAMENHFPEFKRPYDLYLEGNDQYRGWFNASMINSVIYDGKAPYKQLISAGMTTDEKGKKMSKSLGNGIDPVEFSNKQGADVLRLWVLSTDYTDDQKIGPDIIKQVSETYRKIRNTMRFMLGNLFDFNDKDNYQKELTGVDKYMLYRVTEFKNKAKEAFDSYKFSDVYNLVINFITKDLSSFYLDFIKDIVYVDGENWTRRRQVQTVLYEIVWALIDVLRPVLPFTMEEAYKYFTSVSDKKESVHLLDVKEQDFKLTDDEIKLWTNIMKLRDDVNLALEKARDAKIINKGFEAEVKVLLKPEYKEIANVDDLKTIFIVSKLDFVDSKDNDFIDGQIGSVKAIKREGQKCERCWGVYDHTTNGLCDRCIKAIDELKK